MDLLVGGAVGDWYGGWAMAFCYGSCSLEMSPDNGTTWFAVNDSGGNPITAVDGLALVAVLPKNVQVRATGTGTKITLVRGYANTRSAGG